MYQYQVGSLSDIVKPYPLGMFVTEKLLFSKKNKNKNLHYQSSNVHPPSPLAVVIQELVAWLLEVQGWLPQCPGRQPTVTLPIWPPKSPPHLIGQITRCSQTPVVAWQRPSEESDNVCKLLMLCLVSVRETLPTGLGKK